jgi:hypothetical protein
MVKGKNIMGKGHMLLGVLAPKQKHVKRLMLQETNRWKINFPLGNQNKVLKVSSDITAISCFNSPSKVIKTDGSWESSGCL